MKTKTKQEKKFLQLVDKIKISDKIRDFNYIMDKLIEVDLLKNMMLNNYQSLCLNYMQKPRTVLHGQSPHRFSSLVDKADKNIQHIENYFLKLLKEREVSGYDEYIFTNLDDDVKAKILSNFSLFTKTDR